MEEVGSTGKGIDTILEPGSRKISIGSKDPKLYPPGNPETCEASSRGFSYLYLPFTILHMCSLCA